MTQRESGQDFDPKHRIIGAVVIVVLAVILIPMILSDGDSSPVSPDTPAAAPRTTASEQDPEPDKVAVTNLPTPEAAAEPAKAASAPKSGPDKIATAAPAAKPPEPKSAPAATTAPSKSKTVDRGWVVQVGTFSNAANATRLEKKLRTGGESTLVERIKLEGGEAVRLRVGPFADRETALKAQTRIRKEVGVKGVVLAYP